MTTSTYRNLESMARTVDISLAHYWRTRQASRRRMTELRERCLREAGCEPYRWVSNKPQHGSEAWHTWIECFTQYSHESALHLTWGALCRTLASIRRADRD